MTRLALLSCALLVACGGSSPMPPQRTYDLAGLDFAQAPPDLSQVDMATLGDMPATDLGGDMQQSPKGPVITLVAPTGNQKSNNLTIQVSVTSPISATIASVTATIGSGSTPATATLSQAVTGTWQGSTDVTAIASGTQVPLVVTATDVDGNVGKLSTTFTLDHGPTIVFVQPTAMTAKDSIPLKVTITDPLGQAINPAQVFAGVRTNGDVTFTSMASGSTLTIQATITFSSYSPPLSSNEIITVTAMNADGAMSTAQKTFTVDQTGPTITIQSPAQNAFAGGLTLIQATITDISGVNNATVSAEFAGNPSYTVALAPSMSGMNVYSAMYDLTQLGNTLAIPTVSVTAQDQLGNQSTLAQPFYLDNEKPVLSLTPPEMRMQRQNDGVCSDLFNPLGDAVSDLATSQQAISIRARIEDQGNQVSGQKVVYVSGINASTVRLIVTPAATANGATPVLVVNDGTIKSSTDCNAINPLLMPVASGMASVGQYISLQMNPLISIGAPSFVQDTIDPVPAACTAVGDAAATAPSPMCSGSGSTMSFALQYLAPPVPAIWSLPTIGTSSTNCVGQQFDSGNLLPEGWACFAVIAQDNTGNKAISPPLRTCIRYPNSTLSPHPCDVQSPPDCRGTYNMTTNTTDATTPCNAVNFPSGEIRTM